MSGFATWFFSTGEETQDLVSKVAPPNSLNTTADINPVTPFRRPAQQSSHSRKVLVNKSKIKMRIPATSHPELDQFTRLATGLPDIYILNDLVAEFRNRPNLIGTVTEVAGHAVFQDSRGKNNVIFDQSRGLYGVWTGLITLSVSAEQVQMLADKYSLSLEQSIGSTRFFRPLESFDIVKDLPELKSTEGVSEVALDLSFGKIKAR